MSTATSVNEYLYHDTTGTLLMKLKREGERDIEKMSFIIDELRQQQIKEGIYSFDCFTDKGSQTQSNLALQLGESLQECSIWSINHYLGLNCHPYVIEKSIEAIKKFGTGC